MNLLSWEPIVKLLACLSNLEKEISVKKFFFVREANFNRDKPKNFPFFLWGFVRAMLQATEG